MKRNQVNMIFVDQVKRKRKIFCFVLGIILLFAGSMSFLGIFLAENKTQYVKYKEKSDLDYQVYLKDNEFFGDNFLDSENQYIASLIDYITAEFNYNLEVEDEDIDYNYSYRIEADITVKEKNSSKYLYNRVEELDKMDFHESNSSNEVNINKKINIDYNHYNDLIKKFVNVYDLDDVESTLTINMYVVVVGDCDSVENVDTESVISLEIPLTTKTIGIDMKYDLVDANQEKLMVCEDQDKLNGILYLIVSFIILAVAVYFWVYLVLYIIRTRTAETIYERELKKILNNYKSYIQKANNNFILTEYQVIKIDTFTDLLEIRDTINQPILMVENKDRTGVFFVCPSVTKLLYTYSLKVSDIRIMLEEKNSDEEFEI